jgi:hypothetical protein
MMRRKGYVNTSTRDRGVGHLDIMARSSKDLLVACCMAGVYCHRLGKVEVRVGRGSTCVNGITPKVTPLI